MHACRSTLEDPTPGGAGVYYHFDYVGGPRNYKWINVTPITKVWEQMHLAWQLDANRIWIVNVGDLKPMEFPIEFFLAYAWDPAKWPYERLGDYTRGWAEREFGAEHAKEIAALIDGYTKLNRHRTPEMMSPDTYSLANYDEAARILAQWRDLVARADAVNAALPESARAAFFQLVHYPVKASATVREVHIAAARNALYAEQGRALAANAAGDHARSMFAQDAELKKQYHALLDGKWNHTMAETKFGYTYWQTPPAEVMPSLVIARPASGPAVGLAVDGSRFAYPRWGMPPPRTPAINVYDQSSTWVELFSRGDEPLEFKVSTSVPWLRVNPSSGSLTDDVRLNVDADWSQVPLDTPSAEFVIEVSAKSPAATGFGQRYTVTVPVLNPTGVRPDNFKGHVETNGVVSIEAPHYSRTVEESGIRWKVLPDHGRTLGGVTAFPVTAAERAPGGHSSRLEYDFHLFTGGELKVDMHFAPSLDYQSGEGLRFAVSVDDAEPQVVKLGTWQTNQTWEQAVGDSVRRVMTTHTSVAPGRHTLKFWMVTPGVVLQKIVIEPPVADRRSAAGVKPSYLGPPESPRLTGPASPWTMPQAERDRIWSLNEADHDDMLRQLGITKLRPGRDGSGRAGAANAANYDEAKANPFPDWPELLTAKDGTTIATAEDWWKKRRPEIIEDFEREVVGRIPEGVPSVTWEVTQTVETNVGGLPAIARRVVGHVDNSAHPEISVDIKMAVVLPVDAKGPVPVLMMFGWGGMPGEPPLRFPGMNEPAAPPSADQLIAAGWGYVSIDTSSIQADNGAGLTSGIIGLTNKGKRRTPEQWGALRAWAWGASRALDYLETVPEVDARRVGIEGVSRYGKAALVAMAFDPRFAAALIGSSGEGGVKPHRRNFGEAVENLTGTYSYHWMAGNFVKYGAEESTFGRKDAGDIPVDAHQLIALCAPRPTFISYGIPGKGDALWLDQQGSYMATVAAGGVFRLLGAKDTGVTDDYRVAKMPPVNKSLLDGDLAWRQHDGGHEDRSNMSFFIGWANKLLKHWPPHRSADTPVMRLDRTSHLAHADLLQKAKQGREGAVDVYFQGDSIFRRWGATDYPQYLEHFNKSFHGWNAANFAWGADQTQHILWRMDNGELDGLKPKVFVFLGGTNNVGGTPPDDAAVADISRGIAAIVGRFRQHAPAAKVIVMGILPRADHPEVMPGIRKINANVAKLADGKDVFYVDVTDRFTDPAGNLIEELTMDKLHPNLKGYEIMGDAIRPLLERFLGPPAATDRAPPPTGDPSAAR